MVTQSLAIPIIRRADARVDELVDRFPRLVSEPIRRRNQINVVRTLRMQLRNERFTGSPHPPDSSQGRGRLFSFCSLSNVLGYSLGCQTRHPSKTPVNMGKITVDGGGSGIRTHGTLSRTHAFQACALSHSAIPPSLRSEDRVGEATSWPPARTFSSQTSGYGRFPA